MTGKPTSAAKEELFGRNVIRRFEAGFSGRRDYAFAPYLYFACNLKDGEALDIVGVSGLKSFSAYAYAGSPGVQIGVAGMNDVVSPGDVLQAEAASAILEVRGGSAEILVAGVADPAAVAPGRFITRAADVKKVVKPWGFELWLNAEHPSYAFKHIVIRKGFRTSLQYHQIKRETNVLMAGTARCSYKLDEAMSNDAVRESDIGTFEIEPIAVLDVFPNTLHRIESVSDITLCEVSTPHLDDVVRVIDDSGRANGRIPEEHRKG